MWCGCFYIWPYIDGAGFKDIEEHPKKLGNFKDLNGNELKQQMLLLFFPFL